MSTSPMLDAPPGPAAAGLHAHVLDRLGTAICAGDPAPESVLSIEDLVARYAVSRSVVREVLRVLAAMGLVQTRRRVGIRIRPEGEWNVFDPQVIRWRLASTGRRAQLRSITELRTAVEPLAAALAAERATPYEASDLVSISANMWAAGKAGDEAEFLRLDIQFHRLVLVTSGNEMFARLRDMVAEVLTGRHQYGLMPHHPDARALELHADVAAAIQRGDGERSRGAMLKIMEQALAEMSSMWGATEPPR